MKKCSRCGGELVPNSSFCGLCGAPVIPSFPSAEEPAEPVAPVEETVAPVAEQVAPVQEEAPVESSPAVAEQPVPAPPVVTQIPPVAPNAVMQGVPAYNAPVKKETDHTDEFSAEDVAENKLIVVLAYLMPLTLGAIICTWFGKIGDSAYLKFHSREILKLAIVSIVLTTICAVTSFLVIPAIVLGVVSVLVIVLRVIGVVQALKGQSKELPILDSLSFLK
jgi:uncharacterized membrane protein